MEAEYNSGRKVARPLKERKRKEERVGPKTRQVLLGSGDGRADEETRALCKGDKDIAIISRTIVNLS